MRSLAVRIGRSIYRSSYLAARMGTIYLAMEGFWRRGWTHIGMFFVGGTVGLLVGSINQSARFYHLPIWVQSFIGAIITLAVEFVAGLILNVWLGLGIWDYSQITGNIMGQICPQYGILWFFLMPYAIGKDDQIRHEKWGEGFKYPIWHNYRDWFKSQRGLVWNVGS